MYRKLVFAVSLCMVCAHAARSPSQGPSDQEPDALLPVREIATHQDLFNQVATLYNEAAETIERIATAEEEGKLAGLSAKVFAEAHVALSRFNRVNRKLQHLGEPSGYELELRHTELSGQYRRMAESFKSLPKISRQINNVIKTITKSAKGKEKALAKVDKLLQEQKWEEALDAAFKLIDELDAQGGWVGGPALETPYSPFNKRVQDATPKVFAAWKDQNKLETEESLKAAGVDFNGLIDAINAAANSLQSSGQATIDGNAMDGPTALGALGKKWFAQQGAAVKYRGIALSEGAVQGGGAPPAAVGKFESEHKQFVQLMIQGLGKLIDADAARATPQDAERLYADYLRQCTVLTDYCLDQSFQKGVEPALERLAARSPELLNKVKSYRNATSDLLRWKERIANLQERQLQTQYPPLEQVASSGLTRTPPAAGMLDAGPAKTGFKFLTSADRIVQDCSGKLADQKVSVSKLLPDGNGGQNLVSQYRSRCIGQFAGQASFASQRGGLQSELMVTDALPPLTLETYMAVNGTAIESAGGTINAIELHAMVTQQATVQPTDYGLIRLADLPTDAIDNRLAAATVIFGIQPDWYRTRYFFVSAK